MFSIWDDFFSSDFKAEPDVPVEIVLFEEKVFVWEWDEGGNKLRFLSGLRAGLWMLPNDAGLELEDEIGATGVKGSIFPFCML